VRFASEEGMGMYRVDVTFMAGVAAYHRSSEAIFGLVTRAYSPSPAKSPLMPERNVAASPHQLVVERFSQAPPTCQLTVISGLIPRAFP
jgi:hypothetical protein